MSYVNVLEQSNVLKVAVYLPAVASLPACGSKTRSCINGLSAQRRQPQSLTEGATETAPSGATHNAMKLAIGARPESCNVLTAALAYELRAQELCSSELRITVFGYPIRGLMRSVRLVQDWPEQ